MLILVSRVKVKMVAVIGHVRTVRANRHGMAVPIFDAFFPTCTPFRSVRRKTHGADRLTIKGARADVAAADKAFFAEINLVDGKVINHMTVRAVADKRVEIDVFKEQRGAAIGLIGIVFTNHTFAGCRVVRLTDPRKQHQMHVVQLVSRQNHQISRLIDFFAIGIDIGDTLGGFAISSQFDLQDFGIGAVFEVLFALQGIKDAGLRRGFRIVQAAKAFAETTEVTRAKLHTIRVGIRGRGHSRRTVVWVISHFPRSIGKHVGINSLIEWRHREFIGTRRFKRVAAFADFTVQVACIARNTSDFFKAIKIGFELFIADAPILNGHVIGNEFLAEVLFDIGFQFKFFLHRAEGVTIPVHTGTTNTITRQERAKMTIRQGGFGF